VEGGAGRIRMETGTPLCRPTPEAATGRCIVVSNLNSKLRRLWLNVTATYSSAILPPG